ncbi:MAG: phosphoadenosine phosphosulfate reductase [Gammaproteobacteria bacterium]|nr:phosphoadenosine phosphosulfate reductase [Gammaproteobacteria bacterium]MCF6229903.1 phosphoadenosine phosphosulfate reductase [Gammaproteobacteria bacterium]
MYIIRSNYSNNAIALVQWAHQQGLQDVVVCYVDTGWAAEGWLDYVAQCERYVEELGFRVKHLKSRLPFDELMSVKNGFPTARFQWCSLHLKGIPLLQWLEEEDPEEQATILIGKRRTEHENVPEFIDCCEFHGERKVWHPLLNHSDSERNALIAQTGFEPLSTLSGECSPCINSRVPDLSNLSKSDIAKVEELEEDLDALLFNPEQCAGNRGIVNVVSWAKQADKAALDAKFGCSFSFGCGV